MAKTKKAQTVDTAEEQAQDNGGNVTAAVNSKPHEESEKPLDATEEKLLKRCEETIDSGVKSWFETGESLLTILNGRLYRGRHYSSFDDYCSERWDMSGSHARRLMDAAQVRSKLRDEFSPNGEKPLPQNEAQARPLATLKEDQWVSTWEEIVKKAEEDGQPITGQFVEAFVSALTGNGTERKSKAKKPAAKSSLADTIMDYITKVKKQLKDGNTDEVVKLLNDMRKFVREQFA